MSRDNSDRTLARRTLLRGAGAIGATLVCTGLASASSGDAQYLVSTSNAKARQRIERAGFTVRHVLAEGSVAVVTGPAGATDELRGIGSVSAVTRDVTVELSPPEVDADASSTPGEDAALRDLQWDKDLIRASEAHEVATGDGSRIAIVDTGIDLDHPDLGNVNEDLGAAFVANDDVPEIGPGDSGYHGTHCAGIAAATGEVGVVGVAPEAELVPIRVFPADGGATFGDILKGIDYAAEIGADVANFSLGIPGVQQPGADLNKLKANVQRVFQSAVRRGTVITGSAGNDSGNLQQGGGFTLPNSVPAVITISATSPADTLSFYSNYGTSDIDVAAPGGWYETIPRTLGETGEPDDIPYPFNGVLSTWPTTLDSSVELPGYDFISGTSMAAPQVAGLVGLVRSLDADLNANQVESVVERGADLTDGKSGYQFGAGRVDAKETLSLVDDT
ncbi:S8 family serine peptidase [Salinirubellus salinus]|uniref:S8 family serine peptidase n=1 Tax=Salinirubellus salinus TaxID=1364945 RepID=A0A9E7R4I1_9EURY|nr:S8 family serine peptidase [Salinirubellus salinus]UWM55715.1 S8 family serine peptidase [Salinirubellus salinus]